LLGEFPLLPSDLIRDSVADIFFLHFSVGGALPSARTFDLNIRLKDSMSGNPVFSAVNKEELTSITEFLSMKKIKVKNEMEELAAAEAEALGGALAEDSDDDDAMSVDSDDDDRPKKRQSAKQSGPTTLNQMAADDDEDSEGKSLLCCFRTISSHMLTLSFSSLCEQSTRTSKLLLRMVAQQLLILNQMKMEETLVTQWSMQSRSQRRRSKRLRKNNCKGIDFLSLDSPSSTFSCHFMSL
jgi:hypothetical protein